MNDYIRLTDELCKVGNLEPFREAIRDLFTLVAENPCKIALHTADQEPTRIEVTNGQQVIRIKITGTKKPLDLVWDLMHEYGHFLSSERKEGDTDIMREMLAWEHAVHLYIRLPRLFGYADDLKEYLAYCVYTYMLKALADYQKTKKFDIRTFLAKEMPSLIELVGNQDISWASFNKGLQAHLISVAEEMVKKNGPVMKDANFYSVLVGKVEDNHGAVAMFGFFESVFQSLNQKLTSDERKKLHPTITQLLSNIKRDYLHFIGELAWLNKYISNGNYQLEGIEEKIMEGKEITADFLLKDIADGKELLLEVVNVRLEIIKDSQNNFDGFKYNLDSKFSDKTGKKIINPNRRIELQPVIWYRDNEQLKLISSFFIETSYSYPNVLQPWCYASRLLSDGTREYYFGNIDSIFNL